MTDIDVLIRGAKVIDGTGNPWFYGDVALTGDTILEVQPAGRIAVDTVREVVDATGMVVCPGFIDIQSHSIVPLDARWPLPLQDHAGRHDRDHGRGLDAGAVRRADIADPIRACWRSDARRRLGRSNARLDPLRRLARRDGGPWRLPQRRLVPRRRDTARVRQGYGDGQRPPDDEMAAMRRVMAEAMEDGAFGVSYALIYPPDAYVDDDEIVEICKVVAPVPRRLHHPHPLRGRRARRGDRRGDRDRPPVTVCRSRSTT